MFTNCMPYHRKLHCILGYPVFSQSHFFLYQSFLISYIYSSPDEWRNIYICISTFDFFYFYPMLPYLQEVWRQLLHPFLDQGGGSEPKKRCSISSGKTRSTMSGKSHSSISSPSSLSPQPVGSRSSSAQSDRSLLGDLSLLDMTKQLDPAAVLHRVAAHHRVNVLVHVTLAPVVVLH